jgi:GNAT superfamily N-acetyltransferase
VSARDLKLVFCIRDQDMRQRCLKLAPAFKAAGKLAAQLPNYKCELQFCDTRQEAIDYLRKHLAQESCAAILLFEIASDPFARNRGTDCGSYRWAEELRSEMATNCATIAIMRSPERLQNVDRVVAATATREELLNTIKLITEKLSYIASPEKRTLTPPPEIRIIRKQHELLEYFKLRHRIYTIMGYLEGRIENAPSRMEINWCDTISIHIGAYDQTRNRPELLAGTARVVVGTAADATHRPAILADYNQKVSDLASRDPVLEHSLSGGVLPFQLPIFHSQSMKTIFRESVRRNQICGELSRVIVGEDYRGIGLSRRLVEFALGEAARVGVTRMFLECLDIHEGLYNQMGFARIKGTSGIVIGVNQTMIAMELSRPLVTPAARAVS